MDLNQISVADASRKGLMLDDGSSQRMITWSEVTGVYASCVPHGEARVLVLGIGIGEERTLVVSETEKVWVKLVAILPEALPGIPSFEEWAPPLVENPEVMPLFQRQKNL